MEERTDKIRAILVLMKFASDKDLDILLGLSNIVSVQAKYTIKQARARIENANKRIADSNARLEKLTARQWRMPNTHTKPLPMVIGGQG